MWLTKIMHACTRNDWVDVNFDGSLTTSIHTHDPITIAARCPRAIVQLSQRLHHRFSPAENSSCQHPPQTSTPATVSPTTSTAHRHPQPRPDRPTSTRTPPSRMPATCDPIIGNTPATSPSTPAPLLFLPLPPTPTACPLAFRGIRKPRRRATQCKDDGKDDDNVQRQTTTSNDKRRRRRRQRRHVARGRHATTGSHRGSQ